jgi:hypothetical protein
MPKLLRRISDADLKVLKNRQRFDRRPPEDVIDRLERHLQFLTKEAFLSRGKYLRDRVGHDDKAYMDLYQEWREFGHRTGAVQDAVRRSDTPVGFTAYLKKAIENWITDRDRRLDTAPRLGLLAHKILREEPQKYDCFEGSKVGTSSWWGKTAWPKTPPPNRSRAANRTPPIAPIGMRGDISEFDKLYSIGVKIRDGLKLVNDNPDKPSKPIVLRRPELDTLVGGIMEKAKELLQPDHYYALFPRLFPVAYGRIESSRLGDHEMDAADPYRSAAASADGYRVTLSQIPDEHKWNILQALKNAEWDVAIAAAAIGEDRKVVAATLRKVRSGLEAYNYDLLDLRELLDAGLRASEPSS